jgi:hypothetical protein
MDSSRAKKGADDEEVDAPEDEVVTPMWRERERALRILDPHT